jgi:hypothetical protein
MGKMICRSMRLLSHELRSAATPRTFATDRHRQADFSGSNSVIGRARERDSARLSDPRAIHFAIEQPADVDVSEMIVRPTASPFSRPVHYNELPIACMTTGRAPGECRRY